MAEPQTPQDDPVVNKSLAPHYVIASVLLIASLMWALWDEAYGTRPWKRYQQTFKERYAAFLGTLKTESSQSEQEIKKAAEYQQIADSLMAAQEQAKPRVTELTQALRKLEENLAAVQAVFTVGKARVDADAYVVETTEPGPSRDKKRQALDEYKRKKQFEVQLPGEKQEEVNTYLELEEKYNAMKAEKARLILELGEATRLQKEIEAKLDVYVAERMVSLGPDQIEGLRRKIAAWDPLIRQINVAEANIVDRCESCHMGVREPVKLTLAAMSSGKQPDAYARAFVGHPDPELLRLHNPDRFGCAACHGGNGRATSSVVKGHGRHKYWLWPLFYRENVEAGCQMCHSGDMVLASGVEMGKVLNEGKDLFQQRGCVGCHRYEGYDREPELLLSLNQQLRQLEAQKKENLRQAALVTRQADQAADDAEARRLYQQAEGLRVGVSNIEGRIEQVDLQMKSVLRDQKKVGPNLKDIRGKLRRDWIPEWLRKPTDFRPTTKMPNFRLTDEQIRAISAYLWQSALRDPIPAQKPGDSARGKELLETRGCLACHSIGEGSEMQGGDFAANFSRLGEKANYDYIVRWVHNPRHRVRPYCPYEKKDIGPEDYARKGLPYVFDLEHSTCPNDGHELQVQQMTVMPSLRLTPEEAADIATYLMAQKRKQPSNYADASYMEDPRLKDQGRFWIRHYGCAGCHEISGFEDEGRIGTELTLEGSKPIERLDFALFTHPAKGGVDPFTGKKGESWYNHKGFFEKKLTKPDVYDQGKLRTATEALKMPDLHLTPEQIRALTTFLLGSRESSQEVMLPASYLYKPGDDRKDVQEGWWLVKKYNCMGCHQFLPGQDTTLMNMARYQDPDWREQLPPKLLTQGARVDPNWLLRFLSNPALSESDLHRNGVRPYLRARMPTFNFSDNELRKLVRFFQALAKQAQPYIPPRLDPLSSQEMDMARSLFTSAAAPCLKCHATGDPAHDRTATAPNFLLVKERLKPGWTERWMIDPANISPGTSMPSGLFRREGEQWVFNGPVPPSFNGYSKDHTKLLVRYMFQLTPEEQRRVSGRAGGGAVGGSALRKPVRRDKRSSRDPSGATSTAGSGGSR
ncbi:MAG: c-type cytochrome [Acidobacteria bacterium]|nr:c-type cytochrome [Acidobacteriota bacterium]